jgi:hypothetical protein
MAWADVIEKYSHILLIILKKLFIKKHKNKKNYKIYEPLKVIKIFVFRFFYLLVVSLFI